MKKSLLWESPSNPKPLPEQGTSEALLTARTGRTRSRYARPKQFARESNSSFAHLLIRSYSPGLSFLFRNPLKQVLPATKQSTVPPSRLAPACPMACHARSPFAILWNTASCRNPLLCKSHAHCFKPCAMQRPAVLWDALAKRATAVLPATSSNFPQASQCSLRKSMARSILEHPNLPVKSHAFRVENMG